MPEFDPAQTVLTSAADAAIVVPSAPPDRRENYWLLYASPCFKQPLTGLNISLTFQEPMFPDRLKKPLEARIKPLEPVTLGYSFYISDKTCMVAASAMLLPGRTYTVRGMQKFHDGPIAVSTGCTIELLDAASGERVPLLPALARPGSTRCLAK